MKHGLVATLLVFAALNHSSAQVALQRSPDPIQLRPTTANETHIVWVTEAMSRMETIKEGMTRKDLLAVFTVEGGMSTGVRRTFVSRDCPYFKVDVVFRALGRTERDQEGRTTLIEDDRDVITSISRPYLQRSIID